MFIRYHRLPEHIRYGLFRYFEYGDIPGGFLTAVISNDLRNAFGRADAENRAALDTIVDFMKEGPPATCWGSPAAMEPWHQAGGAKGMGIPLDHVAVEFYWFNHDDREFVTGTPGADHYPADGQQVYSADRLRQRIARDEEQADGAE